MDSATSELGNTEFSFGQYKGDPIWHVADEDPKYCEFMIDQEYGSKDFAIALRTYFKAKYPKGY